MAGLPSGLQFDLNDVDDLLAITLSDEFNTAPGDSDQIWAPLHAWRALGQLKVTKAIEPLINSFDQFNDDDYATDELPEVFSLVGEPAVDPLVAYLYRPVVEEWSVILAVACLGEIVEHHPSVKPLLLDHLKNYMRSPRLDLPSVNAFILSVIMNLQAVELIDEIRHMFALGCVDVGWCGDLEDVESNLGVRG